METPLGKDHETTMNDLAAVSEAPTEAPDLTKQGEEILAEAEARLLALFMQPAGQTTDNWPPAWAASLALLRAARSTWKANGHNQRQSHDHLRLIRRQIQIQERVAAFLKPTAQLLANAAVELAACRLLLPGEPRAVEKGLASLENELRAGLEALRWLMSDLQTPPLLQELGLAATLTRYAQRFAECYGIRLSVSSPANLPRLPGTVELAVFRIIQEGLRNVAQHARASHVQITLARQDHGLVVEISDDGRGFAPTDLVDANGLIDMQEWAELLHGRLLITSAPGQGTRLTLRVPADVA